MSLSTLRSSVYRAVSLMLLFCCASLYSQAQNQAADDLASQPNNVHQQAPLSISDAAELLLGPAVATTHINVQLNGITSASYLVGIRRADESLIRQGMAYFENGIPRIIDIEKVETGVLTLFVVVEGRELSATFLKVD